MSAHPHTQTPPPPAAAAAAPSPHARVSEVASASKHALRVQQKRVAAAQAVASSLLQPAPAGSTIPIQPASLTKAAKARKAKSVVLPTDPQGQSSHAGTPADSKKKKKAASPSVPADHVEVHAARSDASTATDVRVYQCVMSLQWVMASHLIG